MTTHNVMTYRIFIPLYNIEVANELLGVKLFDNYTIIKSSDFECKYGKDIYRGERFTEQLLQDITERHPYKSIFYPTAKYILCSMFEQEDNDKLYQENIIKSKKEVSNILLAMRLIDKGFCQINNGYYLANGHASCLQYKCSSQLPNIECSHHTYMGSLIVEEEYNLTQELMLRLFDTYKMLEKLPQKDFIVPITYFHKYYDSYTPYDRILQLAIILESTLLAGRTEELNYRLGLRTSALLGKDYTDILKLFYSIRSHIVHNGYIGKNKGYKDIIKKLKNLVNIQKDDETELLYYFVTEHIEPIIRKLLYKSFECFCFGKIDSYDALAKALDDFINRQITKDNFDPPELCN